VVNRPKFAEIMIIYVAMTNLVQRERERERQTEEWMEDGWTIRKMNRRSDLLLFTCHTHTHTHTHTHARTHADVHTLTDERTHTLGTIRK
jgi:ABC-type nickel/cobalt efflux system permease component RcnA